MEHFIKEIRINNVRHLKDISIILDSDHRQHLILTGRNGSGKTSILDEIANNLLILNMSTDTDFLEVRRQLRQDMNLLLWETMNAKGQLLKTLILFVK